MGWERKRGKLAEFNQLVLGAKDTGLRLEAGDVGALSDIRFVITLDADTRLSRGSAARLVATLAHPLHRPRYVDGGRIAAGYTVLQPRVEIAPGDTSRSLFAALYQGETGLDLYTHAVSDAYQDLFAEGIYAGKGIYDVAAFEQSLSGRVPENTLLSHDLFEGVHGRAGLVSDVAVFEEYPSQALAFLRRMHRWVRGDWQILPWLFRHVPGADGKKLRNSLSAVDRWKIFDNLRRSLLSPSLLAFMLLGWTLLPGAPWLWGAMAIGVLVVPVVLSAASAATRIAGGVVRRKTIRGAGRSPQIPVYRLLLAATFLPHEAAVVLDAVSRTLYRMFVSRRHLLQWTSAAHTARALSVAHTARNVWRETMTVPAFAALATGLVWVTQPHALLGALPFLAAWFVSPQIAWLLSRPTQEEREVLNDRERRTLRLLARRTWHYFERFITPHDHWLPPDNFQEEPGDIVARRTSPTNMGVAILAPVAAYDLGYIGVMQLAASVRNIAESMDRLERYRGHFFNWYATSDRVPLEPRYISSVDSGNLAACLMVLRQACTTIQTAPVTGAALRHGIIDTAAVLDEVIQEITAPELEEMVAAIRQHLEDLRKRVVRMGRRIDDWRELLTVLEEHWIPELDALIAGMVSTGFGSLDTVTLRGLRSWSDRIHHSIQSAAREFDSLIPWHTVLRRPPLLYQGTDLYPDLIRTVADLTDVLGEIPNLDKIDSVVEVAGDLVTRLDKCVKELMPPADLLEEATTWNSRLSEALDRAAQAARRVRADLSAVAEFSETQIDEMDFGFLFDRSRRLFRIGYNASAGEYDPNFYDLLASEARIASIVAIAMGEVPASHWLYLRRPFGRVAGRTALLSWGGSMFEYLLPRVFTAAASDSVLTQSCEAAVKRQIMFARFHGIPWGISESSYYRLDASGNYQYRSFGVPGLGLKRDLGDRLVVTPYASLLAVSMSPRQVVQNLRHLATYGMVGQYGLFEALDFGPAATPAERNPQVVQSYMSHHQGMVLLSLTNFLASNVLVRRFHADARIASLEPFLHEQVPKRVPVEREGMLEERTRETTGVPAVVEDWRVPIQRPVPPCHVLSNGNLNVLLTATGGGGCRWKDVAVTRWRNYPAVDAHGTWIYVSDRESGDLWSTTYEPTRVKAENTDIRFATHMVEYRRRDHGIALHMRVVVPPYDDVEIRHITLINQTNRVRRLSLTSYGEVVLGDPAEDRRHQAFNKLFVESNYLEASRVLLFRRRPRAATEEEVYLSHGVVAAPELESEISCESDRATFLGRGGDRMRPAIFVDPRTGLSGATGATLDPIFALDCRFELEAASEATVVFTTAVARTRREALAFQDTYRSLARAEWAFEQAQSYGEFRLRDVEFPAGEARSVQELFSAVVYPYHVLKASSDIWWADRPAQSGLWGHGLSGDVPILLVRVGELLGLPLVGLLIAAHRYWRKKGSRLDLVILDKQSTGYEQPLRDNLFQIIHQAGGDEVIGQPGGVFLLSASQLSAADRTLLECAAHVIIDTDAGSLADHLARLRERPEFLPRFVPMPSSPLELEPTPPLERPANLLFDNGLGGFSPDGREYLIYLKPGLRTPAPWINVIANEDFGFTVSESGGGCTWAGNSGENRLTPWQNDPVEDPPGEALYLRDEEVGQVWSPAPEPAGAASPYQIAHGAGYTTCRLNSHGLEQRLRLFAVKDEPVKVIQLRLTNRWRRDRRLTATYYVEWVLGTSREITAPHIVSDYDSETGALLVRNPFSASFGERVAFLAASEPAHGLTTDRAEFIGRGGTLARPAALFRIGLSGTMQPGVDPCGALQIHIELAPGETKDLYFLLGQGRDREHSVSLLRRFKNPAVVQSAWHELNEFWDATLNVVSVETPDAAMNVLVNRWLLYQALACRVWGRTALYQSSGATGFRDQLQDVLALLVVAPDIARAHILEAARHQFSEGDVLHWWHAENDRGVRTRCSDDLLWLPFVVAHYVQVTGDHTVLTEAVPFLRGDPLAPNEIERYAEYEATTTTASLYEHCLRALEKGTTKGLHGLPLIGTCDWNDGLSRVGIRGYGESVWLGWFLYRTIDAFIPICEASDDPERGARLRQRAEQLKEAVERDAWDGKWYRRGYYDDGSPLGSSQSEEDRIDSIAQSWAVISGAADPKRAAMAMDSAFEKLVDPENQLAVLLTPPFDKTPKDPGYIKGYPPGVRENGGQYNHAAVWLAWAAAQLGDGDRAYSLFNILNPVRRSSDPELSARYRGEPYAVAADVCGVPPHAGRVGWTWYTGSAGWMYRLAVERILGVEKIGARLRINPCLPSEWAGFNATFRHGGTEYRITVENPERVHRGVERLTLDDALQESCEIPLVDDGRPHVVRVRLGKTANEKVPARAATPRTP
jgi:cyclic beta-1,2-glucan synthetase